MIPAGLSLFITSQIVRSHSGSIGVEAAADVTVLTYRLATKTVATALPNRLVMARASDMKRSVTVSGLAEAGGLARP